MSHVGLYVTFPPSDGDEEVLVRGGARIQTAQHPGTACWYSAAQINCNTQQIVTSFTLQIMDLRGKV